MQLGAGWHIEQLFLSERSACAALGCWHKPKWPLFLIFFFFGSSGVRSLPLAAGINEGGHYFRYFSSFFGKVSNFCMGS